MNDNFSKTSQQYTCPICNKVFYNETRTFLSNHRRWCQTNHFPQKRKQLAQLLALRMQQRMILANGQFKQFSVNCFKCNKEFTVKQREFKFPSKQKYYCCRSCANTRVHSDATKLKLSIEGHMQMKRQWQDPQYSKLALNRGRRFTSKDEVYIRDYIISKYPQDLWTFGSFAKLQQKAINVDLYSRKLKICFQFDGIWHFKDIHDQLKSKQQIDRLLQLYCLQNDYRLIRISDTYFKDNKKSLQIVQDLIYNSSQMLIKLGKEYKK